MRPWMRTALGWIIVVATAFALYHLTLATGPLLDDYLMDHGGELSPSEAPAPRPEAFETSDQAVFALLPWGVGAAAGAIASILLLYRRPGYDRRLAIYLALLAIAAPLSFINFWLADMVLPRVAQWFLDLYVIFAGVLAMQALMRLPSPGLDLKALRYVGILLVGVCAVFTPALFVIIWLLDALGVIQATGENVITWTQITGAGALISAVVAVFNLRPELRKEQGEKTLGPA